MANLSQSYLFYIYIYLATIAVLVKMLKCKQQKSTPDNMNEMKRAKKKKIGKGFRGTLQNHQKDPDKKRGKKKKKS